MKPSIIVCVDETETRFPEDGFYVHISKQEAVLRIASVSLIEGEAFDREVIVRTLLLRKKQRYLLGNGRVCKKEFVERNNFFNASEVPAIVIELKMSFDDPRRPKAEIFLDFAKTFKRFTYTKTSGFLKEAEGIFHQASLFLDFLDEREYFPTFSEKSGHKKLRREEDLIRRMLWLFNELCANVTRRNRIPTIGRKSKNSKEVIIGKECSPIFNCPLRNPFAAINNLNLSHFLEHGQPYFTEDDLRSILEDARKSF
ncbi:MAG: hypothetical protein QG653_683 [Patescibacteria group bacterium]|nr:hypothetical protein [Patescibacteria group bacterium]